ncbi:MAG: hypothetical protein ACM3PY_15080 [Omnitrophica WOR_2 bacterium]
MTMMVIGLYPRPEDAQESVRELAGSGYNRENISFIVRDEQAEYGRRIADQQKNPQAPDDDEDSQGWLVHEISYFLNDLVELETPELGHLVAAGPLAGRMKGEASEAPSTSLLDALTGFGIPEQHARLYNEGVRQGSILVAVTTTDEDANEAAIIMNRHHPVDLDRAIEDWRQGKWETTEQDLGSLPGMSEDPNQFPPEALDRERFHYANRLGPAREERTFAEREAQDGGPDTKTQPDQVPVDEPIDQPGTPGEAGHLDTGFGEFMPVFQQHYETTYSQSGHPFEYYQPGYIYGFDLGIDDHYVKKTWKELEDQARQEWEDKYPQITWGDFREAVYYGWFTGHNSV